MAEGHCEAPCVKSRSQNWDPTSWKSRPKSFQVSVLETASVKIQAPKLRSQVLKTMSWKSYAKISQAPKLRSQVLKTMSWKPYPKISQVFLPARPALPVRQTDGRTNGHREGLQNRPRRLPVQKSDCPGRIPFSESDCPGRFRRRIKTRNCRVTDGRTDRRTTWNYI